MPPGSEMFKFSRRRARSPRSWRRSPRGRTSVRCATWGTTAAESAFCSSVHPVRRDLRRPRHVGRGRRAEHGERCVHDHHLHRIICMNAARPGAAKARCAPRAELAMYDGVPYAISHALIEIPWIAPIAMVTVTPCTSSSAWSPPPGFLFPRADQRVGELRVSSVGQTIACLCSTIQTAQAGTGAFIPIAFLFGGCTCRCPRSPCTEVGVLHQPGGVRHPSVVAPQFQRRTGARRRPPPNRHVPRSGARTSRRWTRCFTWRTSTT